MYEMNASEKTMLEVWQGCVDAAAELQSASDVEATDQINGKMRLADIVFAGWPDEDSPLGFRCAIVKGYGMVMLIQQGKVGREAATTYLPVLDSRRHAEAVSAMLGDDRQYVEAARNRQRSKRSRRAARVHKGQPLRVIEGGRTSRSGR